MKYNKGFGVSSLILIIVGVLLIAGGAYYFGKNSNKVAPVAEENQVAVPEKSTDPNLPCASTAAPSITITSPNGGETYTAGQQVTVEWTSCNLNPQSVGVTLSGYPYPNDIQFFPGKWISSSLGSEQITIPTDAQTGKYLVLISTPPESSGGVQDQSDNSFTIKAKSVSTTLPTPYVSAQSGWSPVVQNSPIAYSCIPRHSETSDTIQKIIGTRTYCITILGDSGAGSTHYTYTYKTAKVSGTKTTTFTLRYPDCGVWKEDGTTKYADCQAAQSNFNSNLDAIVDSLM